MNLILQDLFYVIGDIFFLPSMTFTTMMGIFIGAVIYDGDFKQVKKMILSLFCYALLIIAVTLTRVVPRITGGLMVIHPYAQLITIFAVTMFYLFGTFLGVQITKKAHHNKIL